jgi:hypothetical protein
VVEFLSAGWIERLDAAARAADDLRADPPFVIETLVHGPDGDAGYQVRFASDGASVHGPGHAAADVVLVTDPATAWALHQGALRAQDAFAQGVLKVRGRPELLAERAELLAALQQAWAPVWPDTTPASLGS